MSEQIKEKLFNRREILSVLLLLTSFPSLLSNIFFKIVLKKPELLRGIKDKIPKSKTESKVEDSVFLYNGAKNYFNIEVEHDDKKLEKQIELIYLQLSKSDVIFIESTWDEFPDIKSTYFSKLSRILRSQDKKVIDFDPQNIFFNQSVTNVGVFLQLPLYLKLEFTLVVDEKSEN